MGFSLGGALSGAVGGFAAGGPWGALAGGVGGGLLGGEAISSAKQQQQDSVKMAREQMAFQERMSGSAHQRQVADLRAAGLNPILSANSGASSPGGAMGTAQSIKQAGINTALTAAQALANVKNINANTELTEAKTNAISPVSKVGAVGGDLIDYVKQVGATTATQVEKAIESYFEQKSEITGSGAKAYPLGSRPGRNLKLEGSGKKTPGKSQRKYYLLGTTR